MKINRKCIVCGAQFDIWPYTAKNGHGHYCSVNCFYSRKVEAVCEVEGCENKVFSKRLCKKHYTRLSRNGTTDTVSFSGKSLDEKLSRYKIDENTGCWEWTYGISSKGYGFFHHLGRKHYAHRAAYSHFVGPIPEGLMVLHKCDNRKCMNPFHLFIGTAQDNSDDMVAKGRNKNSNKKRKTSHADNNQAKSK